MGSGERGRGQTPSPTPTGLTAQGVGPYILLEAETAVGGPAPSPKVTDGVGWGELQPLPPPQAAWALPDPTIPLGEGGRKHHSLPGVAWPLSLLTLPLTFYVSVCFSAPRLPAGTRW